MSKLHVNTSVEGIDVVDDVEDAIEDGIEAGGRSAGQETREAARSKIWSSGAFWTGELLDSFDLRYAKRGDTLTVILENDAEHAAPIEHGAQYTNRGPPISALIPWVRSHLAGYTLPPSDRESLPEPDEMPDEEVQVEDMAGETIDLRQFVDRKVLRQAFWLQEHIKEEGIDAVHFMEHAEEWAADSADREVAEYISASLKR